MSNAIAIIEEKAATLDLPELDKAMNYTLADAIREGAAHTDQAVGAWVKDSGEMCALSAAYLAAKARHMI